MRKWTPRPGEDWSVVRQLVVPTSLRWHVLQLAHDHAWSGHLGVTKTYDRILQHFFWPAMKADVVQFCNTCHTCQLVGKPNQAVPPAPLRPIPAVGEPFEHILVDCVGPLPKTRAGNQFLLTIMCVHSIPRGDSSAENHDSKHYQSTSQILYHLWPPENGADRSGYQFHVQGF